MRTDNYAEFLDLLGKGVNRKKIARILGFRVRSLAIGQFGDPDDQNDEDFLERFFQEVLRTTGGKYKSSSKECYTHLIGNWKSGNSSVLSIETYYYCYTIKRGQSIVREIDDALYKKSFSEAHEGNPVPGAYEEELTGEAQASLSRMESKFDDFVALAKASGLFEKAADEGISEAAVRAIVEDLGGIGVAKEGLLDYLENWIDDVRDALARHSNEGEAFEAARTEALKRIQQGEGKNAAAPLMNLFEREQKESQRRQLAILDEAIRIDTLALNLQGVNAKLRLYARMNEPEDSDARGAFLYQCATDFLNTGDRGGDNFALLVSISTYQSALEECSREHSPLDWARIQND